MVFDRYGLLDVDTDPIVKKLDEMGTTIVTAIQKAAKEDLDPGLSGGFTKVAGAVVLGFGLLWLFGRK